MARVFICGMPGSGKSTLGKELSRYVSHPFFDLDHLIEDKEGQKIGEIFKKKGEGYFRNIELF